MYIYSDDPVHQYRSLEAAETQIQKFIDYKKSQKSKTIVVKGIR